MKNFIKVQIIIFAVLLSCSAISAQDLMIASGAGYKKPVSEAVKTFEKQAKITVNSVFGNIQMITKQAEMTGDISCIIGDKKFLKKIETKLQNITFSQYQVIGNGRLVLAFRKGISLSEINDLTNDKIQSVFMPQDGKAIYGIAATEALKNCGLTEKLASKTTQVATVPQVVSYLVTGNADAGFINYTEALANKDKLGGFILVPEDKYKEIIIVAGVVAGFENNAETKAFTEFLKTDSSKTIFSKYGLISTH